MGQWTPAAGGANFEFTPILKPLVRTIQGPIVMDDGRIGHVELSFGGAPLMMSDAYPDLHVEAPAEGRGAAVTLYLTADDVDALTSRAVGGGATLDRGPEDSDHGRMAVFRDPFGHRWMLGSTA